MNKKVIIAHPGRQHSHQLAYALYKEGLLGRYCSMIPARKGLYRIIPKFLWKNYRYYDLDLPNEYLSFNFFSRHVLNKIASKILKPIQFRYIEYYILDQFDRYINKILRKMNVKAVIAYENSALHTFREAEQLGMLKILDAASIHYIEQDKYHKFDESHKLHDKINKRKEEEIQKADIILTVSNLARESYINAGISPQKVITIPMGVDLKVFKPTQKSCSSEKIIRFLFCGSLIERKGIDILLEAYQKIRKLGVLCELILIGGTNKSFSKLFSKTNYSENIIQLGKLTQIEINPVLQNSDCLVLPSRHDSFGMVVLEALACGLPVIVSSMVGAKEAICESKNGWVIPVNNVEALVDRMLWCANNRNALKTMREAARAAAAKFSWEHYHSKIIELIKSIL